MSKKITKSKKNRALEPPGVLPPKKRHHKRRRVAKHRRRRRYGGSNCKNTVLSAARRGKPFFSLKKVKGVVLKHLKQKLFMQTSR